MMNSFDKKMLSAVSFQQSAKSYKTKYLILKTKCLVMRQILTQNRFYKTRLYTAEAPDTIHHRPQHFRF